MKRRTTFTLVIAIFTLALAACASATPGATSSTSNTTSSTEATDVSARTKLNLNVVTGDELLATIPGFSNRMVREFQEYRPYVSIQQFRREIGKYVDDSQVTEWEKYVYVPISINDSDAETLQQIPGLDDSEADALLAGRPYSTVDDFLAQLSEFVSIAELEIAKIYLGDN